MKIVTNGQKTMREKITERGLTAGVLREDERTTAVGPFTVSPVHAEVRASVRVTPSKNYQSIAVECSIMIPVEPTEEAIQRGYEWAFDQCDKNISERMKVMQKVLHEMGKGQ